jgi:hypothetical protein
MGRTLPHPRRATNRLALPCCGHSPCCSRSPRCSRSPCRSHSLFVCHSAAHRSQFRVLAVILSAAKDPDAPNQPQPFEPFQPDVQLSLSSSGSPAPPPPRRKRKTKAKEESATGAQTTPKSNPESKFLKTHDISQGTDARHRHSDERSTIEERTANQALPWPLIEDTLLASQVRSALSCASYPRRCCPHLLAPSCRLARALPGTIEKAGKAPHARVRFPRQ